MAGPLARLRDVAHRGAQAAGVAATALGLTGDRPATGPLYAQVSISDPCDQRCVMCCYHPPSEAKPPLAQFGGDRPGMMDDATFRALVDDLRATGTRRIDLVGRGEPLLHPRAAELVAYAKHAGMTVTMISNGTRLDERVAHGLVDAGLDRFRVSLDAATAETYDRVHVGDGAIFDATLERLRGLARARRGGAPHVTLSFTLGALNAHELVRMVAVTHAVGADAAHFQHTLLMTPDAEAMRLSPAQLDAVAATIPAARERARALGIETNLDSFAASPPTYAEGEHADGPAVVPCYVGAFFTVVLGNGNVMPCCQTERPVGSLEDGGFAAVWRGDRYQAFRAAARRLPEPSPALETCECDRCYFRPHNVSVHNVLHPLSRVPVERVAGLLSVDHLLRMSRLDRR